MFESLEIKLFDFDDMYDRIDLSLLRTEDRFEQKSGFDEAEFR